MTDAECWERPAEASAIMDAARAVARRLPTAGAAGFDGAWSVDERAAGVSAADEGRRTMGRVTARRAVVTIEGGRVARRQDTLAVEEPLELRVGGEPFTVTLRTPGHDIELLHGLLAAEGVIAEASDVVSARYCEGAVEVEGGHQQNTYNVLSVQLAPGVAVDPTWRRSAPTTAGAVCGTASVDLVRTDGRFDLHDDDVRVAPETIGALPDALRAAQKTFAKTGGLHGAGLFTASGELLVAREDVDRHNAVDKVLGWALLHGRRPASGCVLMVSGRTNVALAQKAVLAGVPVLAGVSAPSSLAVDVAAATGLTLAGFVRGDRLNLYAHPERVSAP